MRGAWDLFCSTDAFVAPRTEEISAEDLYAYGDGGEQFLQTNYGDNAVQFELNVPVEDPYGYGYGGDPITKKDIHNAIQKINKENRVGESPMQQLENFFKVKDYVVVLRRTKGAAPTKGEPHRNLGFPLMEAGSKSDGLIKRHHCDLYAPHIQTLPNAPHTLMNLNLNMDLNMDDFLDDIRMEDLPPDDDTIDPLAGHEYLMFPEDEEAQEKCKPSVF
ncbi:hypothetical protein QVD17_30887 [Tagetes erecta]|uniref:Uncharacterized protein n=1 Tax=Tagetes erecta TaxID=13708 RepID=A0AAD8K553_TARER|nr:hypothetical protein QVD17_30887 [Tagetes erecta]